MVCLRNYPSKCFLLNNGAWSFSHEQNKGQLLQDPFLNRSAANMCRFPIYLVNGIKLQGQIESFDQYVVLLQEHRDPDGLQARHLHRRAGSSGPVQQRSAPEASSCRLSCTAPSQLTLSTSTSLLLPCSSARSRCVLVGVDLGLPHFDAELDELAQLATTEATGAGTASRASAARPDPALFVGSGKADEIQAPWPRPRCERNFV